MLLYVLFDLFEYMIELMHDFMIGESQCFNMMSFIAAFISFLIRFALFRFIVDFSINFHCEFEFRGKEIKNIVIQNVLSSETHTKNVIAKIFPELFLGLCRLRSHFTGECKKVCWSGRFFPFFCVRPFLSGGRGWGMEVMQ